MLVAPPKETGPCKLWMRPRGARLPDAVSRLGRVSRIVSRATIRGRSYGVAGERFRALRGSHSD